MASYCSACGGVLPDGANYCSVCGKAVSGSIPRAARPPGPLMRPRAGRKVAGICQGLANQYGWDVNLTRVIALLLAIVLFPVGFIIYGLCWILIPEEPSILPSASGLKTSV